MNGELRINTSLDNSNIPKDLQKLNRMVAKGGSEVAEEFANKVSKLNDTWSKLNNEISKNDDKIKDSQRSLEKLAETSEKIKEINFDKAETKDFAEGLRGDLESGLITMQEFTDGIGMANLQFREMNDEIDKLNASITGIPTEEVLNKNIKDAELSTKTLQTSMNKVGIDANELANGTAKADKEMKKVTKSSSSVSKNLSSGVKTLVKYAGALLGVRALYGGIQKATRAWMDTTQEGAQAQADLANIWTQLGATIGPIIQWLISLLQTMLGYVNAIVKAFFGVSLFGKSTAKSLGGATKQAKALNNELKKTAGFDEITTLGATKQDAGSGGGGGGGITPTEIGLPDVSGFKNAMDKIIQSIQPFIDIIKSIDFDPLKKSVKEFGKVAGNTFKILGGSIARVMNDSLGPFIKLMAEDLVPKGIDTFAKILERLNPIIDNLLKDFVEPLINWFLLDFVPVGLEYVYANLDLIGGIIAVVMASFTEFWNLIGAPIAWLAGELLMAVIKDLTVIVNEIVDSIDFFLQKLEEGDPFAQALAVAIGAIVTALIAYKTWQLLVNGALLAFNALQSLNPFTWVVIAIMAIIAIVLVLYKNWESIVQFFKDAIKNIGDWFGSMGEKIGKVFDDIKLWGKNAIDGIKQWFSDGIQNIKNKFSEMGEMIAGIWNGIKESAGKLWDNVKGKFMDFVNWVKTGFKNLMQSAFQGVVNIVSDVVGGLANVFKAPINFIIDGINAFLRGINRVKIPSWVPFVGGKGFSIPELPKLATGTYTTGAMTATIGEKGREAVVPLQNNTEWAPDFVDVLQSKGGLGGSNGTIVNIFQVDGKEVARIVKDLNEEQDFMTNGGYAYG